MKLRFVIYFSLILALRTEAQELNCKVQVVSTQIQGSDAKRIFDNMSKQVFDFMNNTKWTKDNFSLNERIECNIQINVTEKLSTDEYKGTIAVVSSRPVYKSSLNSTVFNYQDQNFVFKYVEFQPFEFNLSIFQNNLTSVLAYYAYMIIAFDYDTFSKLGGTEYFQKAQTIVANAQSASEPGWKAFEATKNRYWLVENLMATVFQPIRETMYSYHRLGFDIMVDKTDDGRSKILDALSGLLPVHKARPASFNMQIFFNAKCDEIVNLFCKGTSEEKAKLIDLLNSIDPANTNKYSKIQTCN
jgi:hypothetical protein